jgi:hypothetical protein
MSPICPLYMCLLYMFIYLCIDRLCCQVVRVPGYRSRGPGFDSWRYQIFWEVVGLERDPLSLVSTTEKLLERKRSGSDLENLDYGRRGSAALTTRHPLHQKLALTSPTSGGRSFGIVRSPTQATKFVVYFLVCIYICIYIWGCLVSHIKTST